MITNDQSPHWPATCLPCFVTAIIATLPIMPSPAVFADERIVHSTTRGQCTTAPPSDGTAGLYSSNTWPDGVVYYTFAPAITAYEQQQMLNAFNVISSNTNLQFILRTTQLNYILITRSTDPFASYSSSIGMSGSQQSIQIWDTHWDLPGVLIHEVGHAVGLYHEQQRPDRGPFIEIVSSNILPGYAGNFTTVNAATFGPYDLDSVMHYDQYGFSIGPSTIRVKAPYHRFWQWRIGQYVGLEPHLSLGDRWVLRHMYGGELPPQPFGLSSPVHGQAVGADWIPEFTWQLATSATSYLLEVDDDPLFRSPIIEATTTNSNYAHAVPLPSNKLYFWRVTAINDLGTTLNFPLPWQTIYTADQYPATLYVDDSAPPDGDGSDWSTAMNDLRLAMEVAYASLGGVSEIRVAQGTYKPDLGSFDRSQSFPLPWGCAVRGGYAGHDAPDPNARDIKLYPSVLSGDLLNDDGFGGNKSDNSLRVVVAERSNASTLLEGFVITGGNASGPNIEEYYGGGVFVGYGDPRISRCTFSVNTAVAGGGLAMLESPGFVFNSTFVENFSWGPGGGVDAFLGTPNFVNCIFLNNYADRGGGAALAYSGARFTNTTFHGNSAGTAGGAIQTNWNSSGRLNNSVLWGNESPDGVEIRIETFEGQTASSLVVSRCLVAGGQAGVSVSSGNTLVWGAGNLDMDPLFLDSSNDNLRLSPGSPCVDSGVNTALLVDILDLDGDGNFGEQTPIDYDGGPRFHDDPFTPNTGVGTSPIVDMGADEYVAADCDNDGDGDLEDFAARVDCMLGPGEASPSAACGCIDFDNDNDIDLKDLVALQVAFSGS